MTARKADAAAQEAAVLRAQAECWRTQEADARALAVRMDELYKRLPTLASAEPGNWAEHAVAVAREAAGAAMNAARTLDREAAACEREAEGGAA